MIKKNNLCFLVKSDLIKLLKNTTDYPIKVNSVSFDDDSKVVFFSNYKDEVGVSKTCWDIDVKYDSIGKDEF